MHKSYFIFSLSALLLVGILGGCDPTKVVPIPPQIVNGMEVIEGEIRIDRTLTNRNPDGADYLIKGDVRVLGATLTVLPGATINFEQNASLVIGNGGELYAEGKADKTITFKGDAGGRGYWKSISFIGTNSPNNVLRYCNIDGGGVANGVVPAANVVVGTNATGAASTVEMRNCKIENSSATALYVSNNSVVNVFLDNVLSNNDGPAAIFHANTSDALHKQNDFGNNGQNYVLIKGSPLNQNPITRNIAWSKLNVPYAIEDEINVHADLGIAAGTQILCKAGSGFHIDGTSNRNGRFFCNGTVNDKINLIGEQAGNGTWKGIFFNSASGELNYTTLDGAGTYKTSETNLWSSIILETTGEHFSDLKMSQCSIKNSSGWGIAVDKSISNGDLLPSSVTQTFTYFENNAAGNYTEY